MKIKPADFTLIEVLVASLLMTIMITGLLIVSANLNTNWQRTTNISRELNELMNIERVLDNSMPNAIPFVWRDIEEFKTRKSTFIGEPNRISFCYLHRLNNLKEGAIRFMGITQEDDQLVVYHKNRPWINFEENLNDDTITRTVLAEGIAAVEFQYALSVFDAGEETLEWVDEWDDEDESRFDIPLAFRIDINFGDDIVETFLYRTAGNSRYQRWGDWKPDKDTAGGAGGPGKSGGDDTPPGGPGDEGPPPAFQ